MGTFSQSPRSTGASMGPLPCASGAPTPGPQGRGRKKGEHGSEASAWRGGRACGQAGRVSHGEHCPSGRRRGGGRRGATWAGGWSTHPVGRHGHERRVALLPASDRRAALLAACSWRLAAHHGRPPPTGRMRLAACYWPPTSHRLLPTACWPHPPLAGRHPPLAAYYWPPTTEGLATSCWPPPAAYQGPPSTGRLPDRAGADCGRPAATRRRCAWRQRAVWLWRSAPSHLASSEGLPEHRAPRASPRHPFGVLSERRPRPALSPGDHSLASLSPMHAVSSRRRRRTSWNTSCGEGRPERRPVSWMSGSAVAGVQEPGGARPGWGANSRPWERTLRR